MKPDIILSYNSTKGGVDTLDKLCAQYTTKRKTLRWPLSLFFTLLDIAAVNATVLWVNIHPPSAEESLSRRHDRRRHLIIEMGESLTKPWLLERSSIQHVTCHPRVRTAMKRVGALSDQMNDAQPTTNRKRGRCYLCARAKEQKVTLHCTQCDKFVCGMHSATCKIVTCHSCAESN